MGQFRRACRQSSPEAATPAAAAVPAPPQRVSQLGRLIPGTQRRHLAQQGHFGPDAGVAGAWQFLFQAQSDAVGGPDLLERVVHAEGEVLAASTCRDR